MKNKTTSLFRAALLAGAALLASTAAWAGDKADAEELVGKARTTLDNFLKDPDMKWARDNLKKAKGVLIVPTYAKGGFVFAAAGGEGTLVAKDKKGRWAGPAFYYMGAASVGLQIGVDVAEIMLMVMTDHGIDALLGGDIKLGADARVAAGPTGTAAQAATADILGFSRTKGGLFAGIAFDGSVVNPDKKKNSAYYGDAVTPTDILIRRSVSNPQGAGLVKDVARAAGR